MLVSESPRSSESGPTASSALIQAREFGKTHGVGVGTGRIPEEVMWVADLHTSNELLEDPLEIRTTTDDPDCKVLYNADSLGDYFQTIIDEQTEFQEKTDWSEPVLNCGHVITGEGKYAMFRSFEDGWMENVRAGVARV